MYNQEELFIRYGRALLRLKQNENDQDSLFSSSLSEDEQGELKDLKSTLSLCREKVFLCLSETSSTKEKGECEYRSFGIEIEKDAKGNLYEKKRPDGLKGKYYPHILGKDDKCKSKSANRLKEYALKWDDIFPQGGKELSSQKSVGKSKKSLKKILQSEHPLAGGFIGGITSGGGVARGEIKVTEEEKILALITSTTPYKPSYNVPDGKSGINYCILPDLPEDTLVDFIEIFRFLQEEKTDSTALLKGTEKRPRIYNGNFPNAPQSVCFTPLILLASIGQVIKNNDYFKDSGERVMKALRKYPYYLITTGKATRLTYNHHIVDFAEQGSLREIVNELYRTRLFLYPKRETKGQQKGADIAYENFDLMASRFLHLFDKNSFKAFLSTRGEYRPNTRILFTSYFSKMEHINDDLIQSAQSFGSWLNSVAGIVAHKALEKEERDRSKGKSEESTKSEVSATPDKENKFTKKTDEYWEKWSAIKYKTLIELESSILSAKSGHALVSQVLIRAGRLSQRSAPKEIEMFVYQVLSGKLPLEIAQNILITFSRIESKGKLESEE